MMAFDQLVWIGFFPSIPDASSLSLSRKFRILHQLLYLLLITSVQSLILFMTRKGSFFGSLINSGTQMLLRLDSLTLYKCEYVFRHIRV